MADLLAQAMTMGGAGLGLAKQLIAAISDDPPQGALHVSGPQIVPPLA